MGIVNVTNDSFYDGGKYCATDQAISQALQLIQDGADILDIGGESTRPGSDPVSIQEELIRVVPVIEEIRKKSSIPISIDTMKPEVAEAAIHSGATLINDVTGFRNPEMRSIAAKYELPICVMHMQGSPKTMQANPHYPEGIVSHIVHWFENQIELLLRSGIHKRNIILDPGIGFGKTVDDNLTIIHNLQKFRDVGFPILLGLSRKSFMYKTLGISPSDVLGTTIAMNTIGVLQGVEILRVHDVLEHRRVLDLLGVYLKKE